MTRHQEQPTVTSDLVLTLENLKLKLNLLSSWIHKKYLDDPTFPVSILENIAEHANQAEIKIEPGETTFHTKITKSQDPDSFRVSIEADVNKDSVQCYVEYPILTPEGSISNATVTALPQNSLLNYQVNPVGIVALLDESPTQQTKRKIAPENLGKLFSCPKFIAHNKRSSGDKKDGKISKIYPKPGLSYTALVALALMNSKSPVLPVPEIYRFICYHFPHYQIANSTWKNSVRHSLSAMFTKTEMRTGNGNVKGSFWSFKSGVHRSRLEKNILNYFNNKGDLVLLAMLDPENVELLLSGKLQDEWDYVKENVTVEDNEEDLGVTPISQNLSHSSDASKRPRMTHSIPTEDESNDLCNLHRYDISEIIEPEDDSEDFKFALKPEEQDERTASRRQTALEGQLLNLYRAIAPKKSE